MKKDSELIINTSDQLWHPTTRRGFLRALGIGGAVVLLPSVFTACEDKNDTTGTNGGNNGGNNGSPVVLNLNTDIGIFNYAYALEQLEAAFYSAVVGAAAFSSFSAEEKEILTDIRNHEVIHREFFRTALGSSAIADLQLNMTAVSAALASRDTILRTAEQFEDLGVSAYNGAGKQLKNATNLLAAGKIVSVEARHAAVIRDLRDTTGRRFAGDDVVDANGLDVKLEPSSVLTRVVATNFLSTAVNIGTQPTDAATPDAAPPTNV